MFLLLFLLQTLVVFFGFGPYAHVHAHSTPPRPLARVEHPTTHALEILPRTSSVLHARNVPDKAPILRHSDAFRLVLSAFDETFHLHLRPNTDLLHPDARINLYRPGPDGVAYRYASKPLIPQDVLAYEGEVVLASHSESRMREDAAKLVRPGMGAGSVGWARIMVHHQGNAAAGVPPVYEGAFTYHGIIHHVSTRTKYLRTRRDLDPELSEDAGLDGDLVIWRDSDVMSHEQELSAKLTGPTVVSKRQPRTCAHDALSFNSDPSLNPVLRARPRASTPLESPWYDPFGLGMPQSMANSTVKRDDGISTGSDQTDNFVHTIGDTTGCPQEQKIVFTGVAADCEYVKQYGSVENATTTILNDWNTVSSLYKQTFNISLGIIKLEIHDPTCPTNADPNTPWNVPCSTMNLDTRLSVFSDWRGKKGEDGAGLWHLLSGCPTGDEVGIAWLGTLCQSSGSSSGNATVSGTAVSTAGRTEWQVIAHETGHNFGAIHDCAPGCKNGDMCCQMNKDTCDAKSAFLMSPTATTYEMMFSPCSIGNICSLMKGPDGGGMGFTNKTCLASPLAPNLPKLISLEQCGNGIVEAGEECDPGQNGDSACCTSDCKLKSGAQCDPGNGSCCTAQCTFSPSSQVCRPSKDDQCDVAESCTGSSAQCPSDVLKPNGQSCGSGLACASGVCTSNDKQCQQLGSSLGLKEECPQASSTCSVTCQDPKSSRQCITLQTKLLDGSPCGYGGTCVNAQCQSGPFFDMVKSWFTKNLTISIPIAVGAGIVLLLILWALISAVRSCGRSPPPATAPVVYATPSRPPSGPNVLRQASLHRLAEPPLTRPSPQPQAQYGHASRLSGNNSVDIPGARTLPYPPTGPAGTVAYQREVRRDGDWVSFGGGAGPGQGSNTYSGWSAPR